MATELHRNIQIYLTTTMYKIIDNTKKNIYVKNYVTTYILDPYPFDESTAKLRGYVENETDLNLDLFSSLLGSECKNDSFSSSSCLLLIAPRKRMVWEDLS